MIYVVLPLALALAAAAVGAFAWAARRGQFDDVVTPPLRAILDDDGPEAGSRHRPGRGGAAAGGGAGAEGERDARS